MVLRATERTRVVSLHRGSQTRLLQGTTRDFRAKALIYFFTFTSQIAEVSPSLTVCLGDKCPCPHERTNRALPPPGARTGLGRGV